MKLTPVSKEDKGMYGCSPCWENERRDVDAVVIAEDTYGVLDLPKHTALCGNHAEVLPGSKQNEGTK